MRVRELMRPATTVESSAHLAGAAYLMKHRGDSALVVLTGDEGRRPTAIITATDITHAVADQRDPACTRVGDLALTSPATVAPDLSAREAARLMVSRRVHHLLVVDDEQLVGLVGISDMCEARFRTPDRSPFGDALVAAATAIPRPSRP